MKSGVVRLIFYLALLLAALPAQAAMYAVKAAGGGNYTTIQACANAAAAGDTCTVYAGTYNEQVTLSAGGVNAYITIQANTGDLVYVLGFTAASHTKIIGFHIQNPSSPASSDCVYLPTSLTDIYITNNTLYACGSYAMIGVHTTPYPSYVYVQNNTLSYSGSTPSAQNIGSGILARGDHWLIENNDISHVVLGVNRTGSYGVTRNNTYHDNYGTDPDGILPERDCTPNLNSMATISGNTVTWVSGYQFFYEEPRDWVTISGTQYTVASVASYTSMTLQGSPPQGSVTLTGGVGGNCHMDFWYSEPGAATQFNLVEDNTLINSLGHDNHGMLAQGEGCSGQCHNLIFRYNTGAHVGSGGILDDNAFNVSVPGFSYVKSYNNDWVDFNNYPGTQLYGGTSGFSHNSTNGADINDLFYYPQSLADFNPYVTDASTLGTSSVGHDLAYCTVLPCNLHGHVYGSGLFTDDPGNQVADPKFVNYAGNDFHLTAGSPAIGAGGSLTTVASGDSGSGNSLIVNDAGFFQDGYGIPGVQPDWIRIGPTTTVQIVSVNYQTNTLTLTGPVSRSPGDPVYLYKDSSGTQVLFGANPDIGAYPFAGTPPTAPWSGILDPSRAIDWSQAGLPATLPDGETTPNPWTPPTRIQCGTPLSPLGGGQDDTPHISAALSACAPGHYVLLGPGTFTIGTSLYLSPGYMGGRNNVTLRGSGPMQTTLQVIGNNVLINIGAASGTYGGLLTSDASNFMPGATSVKIYAVAGAASLVPNNSGIFTQCDTGYSAQTAGQPIEWSTNPCVGSHVDNGGLFICGLDHACDFNTGSSPAANPQHQIQAVRITSAANNGDGTYTVGFSHGLYMPNWAYARSATLQWNDAQYIAVGDGLENFTVRVQDGNNQYIGLGGIATWVKGVRMIGRSANTDFYVGCTQCLAANNYIVPGSNTSSSFGDGMDDTYDSDSLILNNIVQGGLTNDTGGSHEGVVFAYNYGRDVTTAYYQPAVFEHAAGSALTLKEGNQVGSMLDDDTWGTHTLNTWFRNYLSCADPPYDINTHGVGILIDAYARFNNAIGNAIGGTGKCPTYETTTGNTGAIFAFGSGADTLNKLSSMRWGNCDTVTGTCRFQSSEVPTALSGNAAPFQNPVPSNTNLPSSLFLGSARPSWWNVCTRWNTFPTSCAATQTQPFPPAGPDVTGGPYVNGHAYDIPAAIAFQTLPIDPSFQQSFPITGSVWSGGMETLTVSELPNTTHLMGGFQITGVPACNSPAGGEFVMTGSGATTISYALASDPGSCAGGTFKFPDIRQFDERVYGSTGGNPPPGGLPAPQVTFGNVPINGVVTVANASAFAGYAIDWTFTPVSGSPSAAPFSASRAFSGGAIAASGAAVQPLKAGLSIGAYQVTVAVVDGSNNTVTSVSGQITFVNADLSGVRVYPNPWRSDKHAAHPSIIFDGLMVGTTVKIFTVSGHEVKALRTDGPSIPWDLKNDSGDKVASGIYLYVITDTAGDKVRGKVAVIK